MIKGFNKRWTFRLAIDDWNKSTLDTVVMAEDTEEAVNKAVRFIRRALSEYTPSFKKPEPAPAAPELDQEDQAPVEPTAPPEPEQPSAPSKEKKPEGVKGRVRLYCPECGSTFGSFLREYQTEVACKCGHQIDLTGQLGRYHSTCPHCQHESWGKTNVEDPEIAVRCKCGEDVELRWNPKAKEYQN